MYILNFLFRFYTAVWKITLVTQSEAWFWKILWRLWTQKPSSYTLPAATCNTLFNHSPHIAFFVAVHRASTSQKCIVFFLIRFLGRLVQVHTKNVASNRFDALGKLWFCALWDNSYLFLQSQLYPLLRCGPKFCRSSISSFQSSIEGVTTWYPSSLRWHA